MSVKVHEPVCEDSAQDLYFWYDHFLGDQVKDEWNITLVGGATITVVDQETGGIIKLTAPTDATVDEATIDWGDIRSLLISKKVTIEFRAKFNATNRTTIRLALRFDLNDFVQFYIDLAGITGNWLIETRDTGVLTSQDSGIAIDTDYHIYRIECFPTDEVHFYIDGVETTNSPLTTNITTSYLQPYIRMRTRNIVQKELDVDYVVVRQER